MSWRMLDVVRAFRAAGWADRTQFAGCVAAAAAVICVAGYAAWGGLDAVRARTVGVHGRVTVHACAESTATKDPQFWTRGWNCQGSFRSDDGTVTIASVKLFRHDRHEPGPTVAARAGTPRSGWVAPDGDFEWVFALLLAAGLPLPAWWILRAGPEFIEPPGGWPRPPKPPRTGPPQMGNRARRRRRHGVRPKVIR